MKKTLQSGIGRFPLKDHLAIQRKLILDDFRIVTGPRPEAGLAHVPELIQLKVRLLTEKVVSHPEQCRMILTALISEYSQLPVLYLLMAESYYQVGKDATGSRWLAKCSKKFPDYIWAKLKKAEELLQKKKYKQIPKIFNNRLNLRLLYPYRSVFHLDEVTEFTGIIGLYHFYSKSHAGAKDCYRLLAKINPQHPYTRELKLLLEFPTA